MTNEELAVKAKAGDGEALLELWEQNTRLAGIFVSRRMAILVANGNMRGVDADDLKQAAFLAMVRAVNYFDPDKGIPFSAYWGNTVKVEFNALLGIRTRKRDPLDAALSLNAPLGDDPDAETLETIVPDSSDGFADVEETIWRKELHAAMENALGKLLPVQAQVLRLRFYEGLPRNAIAEQMNMGESEVRTLEYHAITELRKPKNRRDLEEYVDLRTDFYRRGSVKRQESPVEVLVERRDWIRKRCARKFEGTAETATQNA